MSIISDVQARLEELSPTMGLSVATPLAVSPSAGPGLPENDYTVRLNPADWNALVAEVRDSSVGPPINVPLPDTKVKNTDGAVGVLFGAKVYLDESIPLGGSLVS